MSRALCATLSFCKVVWRRYLGEVGKFNRTAWLIYPRHCTPLSIKIGQHLLKLCTKVFWCVFMPHSVEFSGVARITGAVSRYVADVRRQKNESKFLGGA